MMNELLRQADELRQEAVRKIRANELEAALPLLDEALVLSDSDEVLHELITITKAGALISLEQNGPEVQALPMIIMRRRNPRHLYLAAYNLGGKYEIERDFKKAHQYDRIALEAAEAAGEVGWKTEVLIALGNICVYDSRIDEAMALYNEALSLLEPTTEHALRRGAATQNLGYCRLLKNDTTEGVSQIHQAIGLLEEAGAHGFLPECYIDLCYGYLDSNELDQARFFGEKGLAEALETRQIRNAHFLLGEICYKQGDTAAADFHFENLARFYPDFPHLKHLLHALDLRSMVNLKL
jgi:tetratricopeptide (TPR) repeat protein